MKGVILLRPRAPPVRLASRESRKAAPGLPLVRATHYHMRVCSAVRRAGASIDAQLAVHGFAWLLLHSLSRPGRPVGLRVGWSSGPRSHEAERTHMMAPAAVLADGHGADLRYTLCSNAVPASNGT